MAFIDSSGVYGKEASAAVQVSVPLSSRGSRVHSSGAAPGIVAVALEMSRVFDRVVVADQRDVAIVLEIVGVAVALTARVECHKRVMGEEKLAALPRQRREPHV